MRCRRLRDKRARVCVATDVAARGIDVASLSLVIHVEVPRDAEVLQHRSGRTGRAGKKGTAVLIVPYPRRRRVEMMLRSARIDAEWVGVPTPEMIREQDRDRLLTALMEPIEASEEERELAAKLLESKTPEDIALALVRAHSSRLPGPEEMIDLSAQPRDSGQREPHHRPGFDDTVWYRMDIGRRQNADPRWILPLLCRRGHITKNEIGAIRIAATETFFQVPRAIEAKFRAALARTAVPGGEDESGITIEPSPETPRETARENRRTRPEPQQEPRHDNRPAPRQAYRPEAQPALRPEPRSNPQDEAEVLPRRLQAERRETLAPRAGASPGSAPYKAKPAFGAKARLKGKTPFRGGPGGQGGGFKGGGGSKGKPHRQR